MYSGRCFRELEAAHIGKEALLSRHAGGVEDY